MKHVDWSLFPCLPLLASLTQGAEVPFSGAEEPLAATLLEAIERESEFTTVDHLLPPAGAVLEVGGMDWLPDGRLVLSTRRGEVWLVKNALAEDPAEAQFTRFAEGLWEGLGLAVVDGEIHVIQRGELSRLRDLDGDDRCDAIDTLSYGWGLSENYHEFAYGLPVDAAGNFYISLNVGFFNPQWWLGQARVPLRGWALRIAPDGAVTPIAAGFRSPCGISLSPDEELFITDNQGDWMPASPVFRVRAGGFYGHPASLDWTPEYREAATQASLTVPPARAATDREPAALWLPYEWSRSPGNLVWDRTGGAFGPFEGQAYLAELTNGMVLRAGFQEVDGVLQGWVLPFRHRVGSAVRLLFAPDGTLFCGLTNRGWGGLEPSDGIARVRWKKSAAPLEIHDVELIRVDGDPAFRVRFTEPVVYPAGGNAGESVQARVEQYHYDYWWEYGSPEREHTALQVFLSASHERPSSAGRELTLRIPDLAAGRVARVRLEGLRTATGARLLHEEFSYTVNRIPGGSSEVPHVARIVPPPPGRESEEDGWLRMTYGDATDAWVQAGWELVAAELDPADPTRFRVLAGNSHLTNTALPEPTDYVSQANFGDASIHVEFTLPEGGRSAVWILGAYGISLSDDGDRELPCITILPAQSQRPVRPARPSYRGAGQLHKLDIEFEAARFDALGRRTTPARFRRVLLDDIPMHEDVQLDGPSVGAPLARESSSGPLILGGTTGPVAIGNIRVKPSGPARDDAEGSWDWLIDPDARDPLAGWTGTENARWLFEDEAVIGEGPRGHLISPRGDYRDFVLRASVKISDGGNSGIVMRAQAADEGWLSGYEAEVNSSFASPQRTGSLLDLAAVRTHLIAPDTWFDYELSCRTTSAGVRLTTRINGILFADALDREAKHAEGHIALQQHHDGSVVEFSDLRIREF